MKEYGILLAIISVIIAGFAQIILKGSANASKEQTLIKKFLNIRVIIGYSIMLLSTLLNVFALKYMDLKLAPVIDAISYIWVPLLSWLLLKERITKNNMVGFGVIIFGVIVFSL